MNELQKELEILSKEYSDLIAAKNAKAREHQKLLDEEFEGRITQLTDAMRAVRLRRQTAAKTLLVRRCFRSGARRS